jgi:hypothetical protein
LRLHRTNSQTRLQHKRGRERERGVIITLVAVFMLFVVGAMAALSIDVVTLYTARSEAQLAADAGALAGARVLANSGVTSDPQGKLIANAKDLAIAIATQVASQNMVGGRTLNPAVSSGEVTVSFPNAGSGSAFNTNPQVNVRAQRVDLPTFFARIWGRTQITVAASATAEAYNPSGASGSGADKIPVWPICVKPWLVPNIDPTTNASGAAIFDAQTGAIKATGDDSLVGQSWGSGGGGGGGGGNQNGPGQAGGNTNGLTARCGDCSGGIPQPPVVAGQYYPGAIDDFPAPKQALPACVTDGFTPYQMAVAGCVQQPIACGANATVHVDTNRYRSDRNVDTVTAARCLIHYKSAAGDTDSIDTATSQPPFQFLAGNQNPVAGAVGKDVLVSDSLVTIPVFDSSDPPTTGKPSVNIIGFLQVFLNPYSSTMDTDDPIPAMIINLAGCGAAASGTPILGNGASPVAVRLISQSQSAN